MATKLLRQEKLVQLYHLLNAYEKQLNDEAQWLGARTVSMIANWIYYNEIQKDDDTIRRTLPDTWFEPEEKQLVK